MSWKSKLWTGIKFVARWAPLGLPALVGAIAGKKAATITATGIAMYEGARKVERQAEAERTVERAIGEMQRRLQEDLDRVAAANRKLEQHERERKR